LGYDPYVDEDEITETSILNISRLDAWLATVFMLLTETETRGGGRQKEYNELFEKNYRNATVQLIMAIYRFVKYWALEELEIGQCEAGKERETVLNTDRVATTILYSNEDGVYYIAVRHEWFSEFISSHIGRVHDCYIAKVGDGFKSIEPLFSDPMSMELSPAVVSSIP